MADSLYATTTEIIIRVAILRANFKIDRESAEIIASIAQLIRTQVEVQRSQLSRNSPIGRRPQ